MQPPYTYTPMFVCFFSILVFIHANIVDAADLDSIIDVIMLVLLTQILLSNYSYIVTTYIQPCTGASDSLSIAPL